jgi:uncharacterized protein YkwD
MGPGFQNHGPNGFNGPSPQMRNPNFGGPNPNGGMPPLPDKGSPFGGPQNNSPFGNPNGSPDPNANNGGLPGPNQNGGGSPQGSYEQQFMNRLNAARAQKGLPQLVWSDQLKSDAIENNRQQNARGMGHHYMPRPTVGVVTQNSSQAGPTTMYDEWYNSQKHFDNMFNPGINAGAVDCQGRYCTFNGAKIQT